MHKSKVTLYDIAFNSINDHGSKEKAIEFYQRLIDAMENNLRCYRDIINEINKMK
jgi:hypothetical protein